MTDQLKNRWIYSLSSAFVVLNALCCFYEFFWLSLLPVIAVIVYLAFVSVDTLLLIIVFFTPLSINLTDPDVRLGLSLPTEPLMIGVMLLFFFRVLYEGRYDIRILRHPVTIALLINLLWILITCITSEMPVVSFKFLLARLWFVIPFYFIGVQMFKDTRNIKRFAWMYIISFLIVIIYTLYNHSQFGFKEDPAHWVMTPFFNDHTAYGALLAMFFPLIVSFIFNKSFRPGLRIVSVMLFFIFTVALIFSYTRAAWVSLLVALLLFLIYKLRIGIRAFVIGVSVVAILLSMMWTDLVMKLEKNRQDSSSNLTEHVQSISNISTDASNLERINRWNSALRMFRQRPVLGWGPGTYSFQYAPFQLSSERTTISTNAGDKGNAHSEYIGPLCESGIPGAVSFIAILVCVIWTGSRLYHRLPKGDLRGTTLAVLLGLVTYFVHGGLNNFLDTDKASVPFWGFIAILVAADVYHKNGEISKAGSKNAAAE
ncbi:MAG TPA: O-antigen ligase family protein [Bacteroidia bacterium]|nr:O-antigen ligase family protein [Bacteroidia bacterium]